PRPREAGRGWPERSEGRVRGSSREFWFNQGRIVLAIVPHPPRRFRGSAPSPRYASLRGANALRPGQGSAASEQAIEKPAVEAAVDRLWPHALGAEWTAGLRTELSVARRGRRRCNARQRRRE